jgi:hypothetical protein
MRAAAAGRPDRRAGELLASITRLRASGWVERGIRRGRCLGG